MVLYPNKLPESERVCSGICSIDEVKVVFLGQDVSPYLELKASFYFLQPCSCRNTAEVVEYIKSHPQWRLSLQTHKLIDIP